MLREVIMILDSRLKRSGLNYVMGFFFPPQSFVLLLKQVRHLHVIMYVHRHLSPEIGIAKVNSKVLLLTYARSIRSKQISQK